MYIVSFNINANANTDITLMTNLLASDDIIPSTKQETLR